MPIYVLLLNPVRLAIEKFCLLNVTLYGWVCPCMQALLWQHCITTCVQSIDRTQSTAVHYTASSSFQYPRHLYHLPSISTMAIEVIFLFEVHFVVEDYRQLLYVYKEYCPTSTGCNCSSWICRFQSVIIRKPILENLTIASIWRRFVTIFWITSILIFSMQNLLLVSYGLKIIIIYNFA